MKKNQVYKNFLVKDIVKIEDCNSIGIHLKHTQTGLEIFHLLNDDKENLFAFTFKTPSQDSTGMAHVLEHSVLCGSKKYPLKDPFLRLANQSVSTYLNAYTANDHTVFPASSFVKADYFNLFSVYADAVFFPLLTPEIFLQECHRLEFDKNEKPIIQGVVYNEMKGNYASFENVASDEIEKVIVKNTNYEFDSGGDPLVIPELTLQKLREFHKKYYCTNNCFLFLYGNISTEEQLDFIDENVIQKIKTFGERVTYEKKQLCKPESYVHTCAPSDDSNNEDKSLVSLVWGLGPQTSWQSISKSAMELMFLDEFLWGDDCAPVSKELLKSGLCEDIAPQTGLSLFSLYPTICFSLRGVEEKNAKKIEEKVLSCLKNLCSQGVSKEDIERTAMSFDFSNREIKRPNSSPYSLVLLRRCLRGWLYGAEPWDTLLFRSEFAKLKNSMQTQSNYLISLIQKYLLQNEYRSLVTVTPSIEWNKKRLKEEELIIEKKYKEKGKDKILLELKKMCDFQNEDEEEKSKNLVPCLKVSDLSFMPENIFISKQNINGIPLYISEEATNAISYFELAYSTDSLKPCDYEYIPFLSYAVTQIGWANKKWSETSSLIGTTTGGLYSSAETFATPDCAVPLKEQNSYIGRDWVFFHVDALEEKTQGALSLLCDCINGTDFSDLERLKVLVASYYNSLKSSIVPHAHSYAISRSCCFVNKSKAVNEIWTGISAFLTAEKLYKMDIALLSQKLKDLFLQLKKGGAILHITAEKTGIETVRKLLPTFIEQTNIFAPVAKSNIDDKDFFELIKNQNEYNNNDLGEVFAIPGNVGFASFIFSGSSYATKESVSDRVYAHYISNTSLWKEIRTAGGAYGVHLSLDAVSNCVRFFTYRDPKPFDSIKVLKRVILQTAEKKLNIDEVQKAVTGTYSNEVTPLSPYTKGNAGFFRELSGITQEQKNQNVKWLLTITPEDLQESAKRFEKNLKTFEKDVIFCGKPLIYKKIENLYGKIIYLSI